MVFYVVVGLFLLLAQCLATPYHAPLQGSAGGKRTLVLMDDLEKVPKFSTFFGDLTSRGHELSYKFADAQDLELQKYGEYLYDNVIIFAPKASSFGSLSAEDILEFVRSGHNLIVAAYRETGEGIRAIAEQVGVDLDPKGTEVIDHLEKIDELDSTRQHTVFLARETISSPSILGDFNQQSSKYPVMFRGIGHKIAKDNILAVRILRGNPTSYSFFPNKAINDSPLTMGEDTLLVSAIQGRNNARVLVAGSLDMFSNAFFAFNDGGMQTGNRKFCAEISKWALGEQGVLRYRNITHHKSDGTPPDVTLHEKARPDLPITLYPDPEIARNSLVYRIKDEIVFSMIVEEFKDGIWQPFYANDMQLEFVMLDPYVRTTMQADKNTGNFVATFLAPDNYGVFKFRVLYRRVGYSVLHTETEVSIRPFKHNEYERFILSAYPYYASALSATVGFLLFSVLYLFASD